MGWVNLVMSWSIGLGFGLGALSLGLGLISSSGVSFSSLLFRFPTSLGTGFRQAIILVISLPVSFLDSNLPGFTGQAGLW